MSTDTSGPLAANNVVPFYPGDVIGIGANISTERTWLSPGTPPWEPEDPPVGRRRPWHLIAVLIGLVLIVASVFAIVAQRSNVLPVWVPLIGKDTGVAACEAMAGGDKIRTLDKGDGKVRSDTMSQREYREIRAIFTGSRYPEIRTNGSALIDYFWQLQALGPDAGLAALPLIGPINQAYTGLSGGCSEHGITIPPLGS
jgi:hypothetical protein